MNTKDNIKTFIDEIYSSPPKNKYPTNQLVYNHNDEIWSIDLLDTSDYGTSKTKGYRYIPVVIDYFSKYIWCNPLKKKIWSNNKRRIFNYLYYNKTKT